MKHLKYGLALLLIAASGNVAGNQLNLDLDDRGGAGGGYDLLQFNGSNHLVDGYMSIVEDDFDFVVDGHRAPIDWNTQTALNISNPGAQADLQSTAAYMDPQFVSWRVDQTTYAWTGDNYVILQYTLNNTWTGGTITGVYPTLWFDFNANGTANDNAAYDAANTMAYQFDTGGDHVGLVLLAGTPHAVQFNAGLPTSDAQEEAIIVAGGIDPAVTNANVATGMAVGPFNVASGTSLTFPVAIVAGNSLADIQAAAAAAKARWVTLGGGGTAGGTGGGGGGNGREGANGDGLCSAGSTGSPAFAAIFLCCILLFWMSRSTKRTEG